MDLIWPRFRGVSFLESFGSKEDSDADFIDRDLRDRGATGHVAESMPKAPLAIAGDLRELDPAAVP